MKIARVIGQAVSTVEHPDFRGWKLLLVQPVDEKLRPAGDSFLAVDAAQAGPGDTVLVIEEGKSARQIMGSSTAPCEAIVAAVVDYLQLTESPPKPEASPRPRRRTKA